ENGKAAGAGAPAADVIASASGADALSLSGLDRLFDGFGPGHGEKRTLPVFRRHVFDALLDLRLDLRVLLHPRHNLLIALVGVFAPLHFSEYRLADEILFREPHVILV